MDNNLSTIKNIIFIRMENIEDDILLRRTRRNRDRYDCRRL